MPRRKKSLSSNNEKIAYDVLKANTVYKRANVTQKEHLIAVVTKVVEKFITQRPKTRYEAWNLVFREDLCELSTYAIQEKLLAHGRLIDYAASLFNKIQDVTGIPPRTQASEGRQRTTKVDTEIGLTSEDGWTDLPY